MRDFSIIQKLIGESVTERQLAYVDCYVQEYFGEAIMNHPSRKLYQK